MNGTGYNEVRKVHRIKLSTPLEGEISGKRIFVVDVSTRGLRIAHQEPVGEPGDARNVTFTWDANRISLRTTIRWTQLQRVAKPPQRALYHSGFEITNGGGEAGLILKRLVEEHVARALDEQKANARGIPAIAAQSVQSGRVTSLVRHELVAGQWRTAPTAETEQPSSGFTISASHPPEEVQMLRETYAASDYSGRLMIRKMAELSIANPAGIPIRKYEP